MPRMHARPSRSTRSPRAAPVRLLMTVTGVRNCAMIEDSIILFFCGLAHPEP